MTHSNLGRSTLHMNQMNVNESSLLNQALISAVSVPQQCDLQLSFFTSWLSSPINRFMSMFRDTGILTQSSDGRLIGSVGRLVACFFGSPYSTQSAGQVGAGVGFAGEEGKQYVAKRREWMGLIEILTSALRGTSVPKLHGLAVRKGYISSHLRSIVHQRSAYSASASQETQSLNEASQGNPNLAITTIVDASALSNSSSLVSQCVCWSDRSLHRRHPLSDEVRATLGVSIEILRCLESLWAPYTVFDTQAFATQPHSVHFNDQVEWASAVMSLGGEEVKMLIGVPVREGNMMSEALFGSPKEGQGVKIARRHLLHLRIQLCKYIALCTIPVHPIYTDTHTAESLASLLLTSLTTAPGHHLIAHIQTMWMSLFKDSSLPPLREPLTDSVKDQVNSADPSLSLFLSQASDACRTKYYLNDLFVPGLALMTFRLDFEWNDLKFMSAPLLRIHSSHRNFNVNNFKQFAVSCILGLGGSRPLKRFKCQCCTGTPHQLPFSQINDIEYFHDDETSIESAQRVAGGQPEWVKTPTDEEMILSLRELKLSVLTRLTNHVLKLAERVSRLSQAAMIHSTVSQSNSPGALSGGGGAGPGDALVKALARARREVGGTRAGGGESDQSSLVRFAEAVTVYDDQTTAAVGGSDDEVSDSDGEVMMDSPRDGEKVDRGGKLKGGLIGPVGGGFASHRALQRRTGVTCLSSPLSTNLAFDDLAGRIDRVGKKQSRDLVQVEINNKAFLYGDTQFLSVVRFLVFHSFKNWASPKSIQSTLTLIRVVCVTATTPLLNVGCGVTKVKQGVETLHHASNTSKWLNHGGAPVCGGGGPGTPATGTRNPLESRVGALTIDTQLGELFCDLALAVFNCVSSSPPHDPLKVSQGGGGRGEVGGVETHTPLSEFRRMPEVGGLLQTAQNTLYEVLLATVRCVTVLCLVTDSPPSHILVWLTQPHHLDFFNTATNAMQKEMKLELFTRLIFIAFYEMGLPEDFFRLSVSEVPVQSTSETSTTSSVIMGQPLSQNVAECKKVCQFFLTENVWERCFPS
eukprot:GHVN01073848.1.p1 GENE.GHVN01073848.1~~GHVN01073848.1.p1  ORF type:complete len:1033 (+),score=224.07 GHVN01073848.1:135-3233(+)